MCVSNKIVGTFLEVRDIQPTRVQGPIALEPAYVTTWESANLCAPPGLAVDHSIRSFPDKGNKIVQLQHETFDENYASHHTGVSGEPGNLLKVALAYTSQSDNLLSCNQPDAWLPMSPPNEKFVPWPCMSWKGAQDFNRNVSMCDERSLDKPKQKRRQNRRCLLRIATQLNELQEHDPRKVITVRKINRLGFDSARILEEHYGRYGPVSKVFLSNAHEKQADAPFPMRLRPSGIAFVLFESSESAAAALAEGSTQVVSGMEIGVRGFEKRQELGNGEDDAKSEGSTTATGGSTPEAKTEQASDTGSFSLE